MNEAERRWNGNGKKSNDDWRRLAIVWRDLCGTEKDPD
jgi:hypothetical protein